MRWPRSPRSTTPDDPQRAQLLTLYNDTRAALTDRAEFLDLRENYAKARAGAGKEAVAMGASLAERHVAPPDAPASTSRAELEQQLQLSRAELAASTSILDQTRNEINSMPERAAQIRARLTELGSLISDLQSELALLPRDAKAGSADEASLWLAQAESASATAEKAALDEELLEPARAPAALVCQTGSLHARYQAAETASVGHGAAGQCLTSGRGHPGAG